MMKARILLFCMAAATMLQTPAADWVYSVKIDFSGTPADGDKITVNGVDRVFKTAVTAAATQVAISSDTNTMAANLYAQLQTYRLTGISSHQSLGTVTLIGTANVLVTASKVGSWGALTVSSNALNMWTVVVPGAALTATSRGPIYNALVDSISTIPTNRFSATAPALLNYFSLGQVNLATGANILSNATQRFVGGYLSNITRADLTTAYLNSAAYVIGTMKYTNNSPYIEFHDADAAADNHRAQLYVDQSGLLVKFLNDAGSSVSNVFEITRDSTFGAPQAIFRTRVTAPYFYDTILSNSLTTNMVMVHSAAALINSLMATGPTAVSNSAPILSLDETDAGANKKIYQWRMVDGVLTFYLADDTGAVASNQKIWEIERFDHLAGNSVFHFNSPVQFESATAFSASSFTDIPFGIRSTGGLIVGSIADPFPTGMANGILLYAGVGPSGTLSGTTATWNSGGHLFYRNGASGEGDAVDNRVHNRTDTVFAAGTDYTLTASTAFVDAGTTDPKVTLPTEGTYWIDADVAFEAGATANDDYRAKLRNETTSTDLSGSDCSITYLGASQFGTVHLGAKVTVATTSNVIAIWAHNNTAARGKVTSARTRISYERRY